MRLVISFDAPFITVSKLLHLVPVISRQMCARIPQNGNTICRKCNYARCSRPIGWKILESWRSSNSNLTTFELRTFSPDSKFDKCFKHFVVECEFVKNHWSTTDSYAQTARERRQTSFFLKFNLSHTHYNNIWMCNIVFAQWYVTLY